MVFGLVASGRWGCVAGKMKCYEESSGKTAGCYYNGGYCGDGCNFYGQNCARVYLPQCATAGHCPQSGYDMTANPCTCDGSETEATVIVTTGGTTTEETHRFCCPAGHTYVNGACSLL